MIDAALIFATSKDRDLYLAEVENNKTEYENDFKTVFPEDIDVSPVESRGDTAVARLFFEIDNTNVKKWFKMEKKYIERSGASITTFTMRTHAPNDLF